MLSERQDFPHILFEEEERTSFFSKDIRKDLNLDQMIESISIGAEREFISRLLEQPLDSVEKITYRQEVFRDLEEEKLFRAMKEFVKCLDHVDHLLCGLDRLVYEEQKDSCFLNGLEEYCSGVEHFAECMEHSSLRSKGLQTVGRYLSNYRSSEQYQKLRKENQRLAEAVRGIQYQISFDGHTIRIGAGTKAPDYNLKVRKLFHPFLGETLKGHCRRYQTDINMNCVEYQILQGVKRLHPTVFQEVHKFRVEYQEYKDGGIEQFRKECQFYLAIKDYLATVQAAGFPLSYPEFTNELEDTCILQGYDLVLGEKLAREHKLVVMNDFICQPNERVYVVTGPNQGGKTTFSRMLGQIHYLATLGAPVPAMKARLILCKGIFTHFEHEEAAYNDNGKLQDDLLRMHEILETMTDHSLVIINEMLSSTSYQDATMIGEKIIHKLEQTDCISIYVTFVDELSKLGGKTVSLVSRMEEKDDPRRTFQIIRKDADGLVYAKSISEKYELTYDSLMKRFAAKGRSEVNGSISTISQERI